MSTVLPRSGQKATVQTGSFAFLPTNLKIAWCNDLNGIGSSK
jgi:hypothetical protein